jgi:16S rRNA G527 N7-methylase RsmG
VVEPVWIAIRLDLNSANTLVDIGSGNGSPAIPILVVKSLHRAHLIEARTKRAAFLRHLVTLLEIQNVSILRSRFEDVSPDQFANPEWITIQAVAMNRRLLKGLRAVSSETTTVVWITSSRVEPPLRPKQIIEIPGTGTRAYLFSLSLDSTS